MAESLTEEEMEIICACLWAADQGPFFVNFWGKSQPLLGATREEIARVAMVWPTEDASSLMVILPKDPKVRAALFAIEARFLAEIGSPFDPEGERGQDAFVLG
ncbi:MAG: hypothetical protein V4671_04345 [Armatimonadota bacterium]